MTKTIALISSLLAASWAAGAEPIDRAALVQRHHPTVDRIDPMSPFTVGNGGFAMTVDVTGLQSFPAAYREGIPLSTQSDWGWHSFPDEFGYQLHETFEDFASGDRTVSYPTKQNSPAGQWLRANPHRLGLGRIGFEFVRADGSIATVDDITEVAQTLHLWTGEIRSEFRVAGVPVSVVTAASPALSHDAIGVTVSSELLATGRLRIVCEFPYGNGAWGIEPEDWAQPDRHSTTLIDSANDVTVIQRDLGTTEYSVGYHGGPADRLELSAPHRLVITPAVNHGEHYTGSFEFYQDAPAKPLTDPIAASRGHWPAFWQTGGAIDLTGSTDPRAPELERRIVLSQYLTAIQCAGDMPPQETGLTFNSWYGIAHLEMHWWHGVHFALWNRPALLERSLPWYDYILPQARAIARRQGYAGARWPKMVDPAGNEKPSTIAPLLIWQQPHPIYFAELMWRQQPTRETLERFQEIVLESAAFMASFPVPNPHTGYLELGPPMIPAQESYDPRVTSNPPFELAYWRWGIETAQAWRERLNLGRDPAWDDVLERLAPYPHHDDVYATAEGRWNLIDHPSVLGAHGMLRGPGVDPARMRRTLHRIMEEQDWLHTWGWDYPLIAMTAARLGETELALDSLLMDVQKNTYLNNGHNFQEPENLRIYLPGNGGLLAAVAMMAAGWDDAPDRPAPGFPADDSWRVRWENLQRLP